MTSDKGHGRLEQRITSVVQEVDWLSGERRFPGELRLPGVACIVRVQACAGEHVLGGADQCVSGSLAWAGSLARRATTSRAGAIR